jgi:hypothetical protein
MATVRKSNLKPKEEQKEEPKEEDTSILPDNKPHKWDESFENICEILIDESQINTFLHQKSHRHYTKWSNRFQLPIIVLSALSGSANFISPKFGENKDFFLIMIGFVSILISIISSVAQYLKLSELKEGHRLSSFHWEKFYNKIKIQLMLKRENRRNLPDFYDELLGEYQRLKEISPIFLKKIASTIKKKDGYHDIEVPFYLNGFYKILPFEKSKVIKTQPQIKKDEFDIGVDTINQLI